MQRTDENYARLVHKRLKERFALVSRDSEIALDRWRCLAKRGRRTCTVVCLASPGPDFQTYFEEEEETIARGITASPDETVEAIWQWLDDASLDALHARLSFVDGQRRELLRIREFVLKHFPAPGAATRAELGFLTSAQDSLQFLGTTRSARLSFDGNAKFPEAVFRWEKASFFGSK